MFKVLDNEFVQGRYLLYRDIGKNTGGITHTFQVTSRKDGSLLGFIKWYSGFKSYSFHCLNAVLDNTCLLELAEYCKLRTEEHREKFPIKRSSNYKRKEYLQKKFKWREDGT